MTPPRFRIADLPARTEISLRLPNSPGALAEVCRLLAEEGINIAAFMLAGGRLRLVVDNHVRAAGVLRAAHHQVTLREVAVVTAANTPGGLAPTLRLAADAGMNVEYAFSGPGDAGMPSIVVLGAHEPELLTR